jgi:hypothetical protein
MASLKVSQKSLTKYSTLYRWNGHFGHLSEVIKNQKSWIWTFWTLVRNSIILSMRSAIYSRFCACARERQRKLHLRNPGCHYPI